MMNRFYFRICILLLLITATVGSIPAQEDPVLRIEIPAQSDEANYKIIPCDETGMVLFYQTTISEEAYKFWVFNFYNKILQEVWKKEIPLFDRMSYAGNSLKPDGLYLFFHNPEKKKSDTYNFQIMKLDLAEGRYELFSGNLPDNSRFAAFEVTGRQAFIGMNIGDNKAGFYRFGFDTKELQSLFEFNEVDARFENLYIHSEQNQVYALFNVFNSKSDYLLQIREYSLSGNPGDTREIRPEFGKRFISGRMTSTGPSATLIIGTFDYVKGSTVDSRDYFERTSSGFYSANLEKQKDPVVFYHDFLELENMTGYLRSREYQAARKKAEKRDELDEKSALNYNLLLHDVIPHDSLLYFVGEAYYEDYHTVTSTYYDYYGRAVPVSYTVFDGYRYFNAFISCYNQQGIKLWDNGMEIFNLLTFDLSKRVNVLFDRNDIVLAYNFEGKIGAKIIDGPEVVEGVEYYPLATTYGNDKLITDTKSNMRRWYDNYFIAWGFQTIRNNSLIDNNKRTVFYINKVAFE